MYVWDERDAYGEDAYIDDFASGDGYGGGAVSASGRSIRDRLLDLGRAAGVEAPPAAVLKELEAFAMAAGLGSSAGSPADGVGGVFSGDTFAAPGVTRVDANAGDAGSVGIGWSVDESVDDDDDVATAASALSRSAFVGERTLDEAGDEAEASPSSSASTSSVSSVVESVDSPLRKVVLARRSTLTFREPMDALALVSALRSRDPDAYQFALAHEDGAAFVGSTPERLFSSRDGRAASEAVAGTRPRGADEGEDAALAYEMLLSRRSTRSSIVREERAALAAVAKDGASGVKADREGLGARLGAAPVRGRVRARGRHVRGRRAASAAPHARGVRPPASRRWTPFAALSRSTAGYTPGIPDRRRGASRGGDSLRYRDDDDEQPSDTSNPNTTRHQEQSCVCTRAWWWLPPTPSRSGASST